MPSLVKRIFVHNFGIKLISLLLAIGLWLVVARSPMAEVVMSVPIVFQHVPERLEVKSADFNEVQILVRGPERLVNRLRPVDVSAHVDLSKVGEGSRTFDLSPNNARVPQGLEVLQVSPMRVTVMMEGTGGR